MINVGFVESILLSFIGLIVTIIPVATLVIALLIYASMRRIERRQSDPHEREPRP